MPCPTSRRVLTFFWMNMESELLLADSLLAEYFLFLFRVLSYSPGWP
ncbi:rCG63299 [Rattus norvegicus]|uniref:RCG63299 n=1 Tax=Rattus norvegicus TaxID=10116 RepID=A6JXR6_RAT|nr:rCG63299 [Rattus norvegicus]